MYIWWVLEFDMRLDLIWINWWSKFRYDLKWRIPVYFWVIRWRMEKTQRGRKFSWNDSFFSEVAWCLEEEESKGFSYVKASFLYSWESKVTCFSSVVAKTYSFEVFKLSFLMPLAKVRSLESKWNILTSLSKIMDASFIALSGRRKNEKSKASVDLAPEVEEEYLKSSFKCEVAAFRWSSNAFSSKSIMSGETF